MLRPVDDLVGQARRGKRTEQVLGAAVSELELGGNPERGLDHASIEEWSPYLEAVRHAHAIDLHEDVVRQVDLEIRKLRSLHVIAGQALAIRRRHLIEE